MKTAQCRLVTRGTAATGDRVSARGAAGGGRRWAAGGRSCGAGRVFYLVLCAGVRCRRRGRGPVAAARTLRKEPGCCVLSGAEGRDSPSAAAAARQAVAERSPEDARQTAVRCRRGRTPNSPAGARGGAAGVPWRDPFSRARRKGEQGAQRGRVAAAGCAAARRRPFWCGRFWSGLVCSGFRSVFGTPYCCPFSRKGVHRTQKRSAKHCACAGPCGTERWAARGARLSPGRSCPRGAAVPGARLFPGRGCPRARLSLSVFGRGRPAPRPRGGEMLRFRRDAAWGQLGIVTEIRYFYGELCGSIYLLIEMDVLV